MELVQPLEKGEFLYAPRATFLADLVIQQGDDLLDVAEAVNGDDAHRQIEDPVVALHDTLNMAQRRHL